MDETDLPKKLLKRRRIKGNHKAYCGDTEEVRITASLVINSTLQILKEFRIWFFHNFWSADYEFQVFQHGFFLEFVTKM